MSEFGRNLDERVRSRLKRILEDGIDQGLFRAYDVEMCTIAIMGILTMFILRHIFGDVPLDREEAVRQVVECYMEGLAAPREPSLASGR